MHAFPVECVPARQCAGYSDSRFRGQKRLCVPGHRLGSFRYDECVVCFGRISDQLRRHRRARLLLDGRWSDTIRPGQRRQYAGQHAGCLPGIYDHALASLALCLGEGTQPIRNRVRSVPFFIQVRFSCEGIWAYMSIALCVTSVTSSSIQNLGILLIIF